MPEELMLAGEGFVPVVQGKEIPYALSAELADRSGKPRLELTAPMAYESGQIDELADQVSGRLSYDGEGALEGRSPGAPAGRLDEQG